MNKNTLSTLFTRTERLMDLRIPPVTILGYHAVSSGHTIVDIEAEMFQKQLAFLKKHCEFISLDQVVNYIEGKETFTRPAVALTFDDGYKDVITTVLPLLEKDNVRATVFAMSDSSHANRTELENEKELMTTKDLLHLHELGWTIGCHSATHAYFADKKLNVQKEIIDSKKQLEKELGFPVNYFAYPKGIYSPLVIEAVKLAGFKAAVAFESGFISSKSFLFTIPRMPVDWTHSMEQFEAFFTNWGVWYLQTKQNLARLSSDVRRIQPLKYSLNI